MKRIGDLCPPGTTVLATHARLARSWREAYDQHQRAAGHATWPTAPVATWDAWLQQCWSGGGDRLLLSATQEHWLWREIIAAGAGTHALLDAGAAAEAAAEAWRLAQHWQLPWPAQNWGAREETAAFLEWADELRRRAAAQSWITAAELPEAITHAVRRGGWTAPACLLLADDAELPPAQKQLLEALAAAGTQRQALPPVAATAVVRTAVFPDPAREFEAVAAWARSLLERGEAGPIGVIVPGLAQTRAQVERIFLAELHPPRPPWESAARAFHLSLGEALAQTPAAAAALAWIELLAASGPQAAPLETAQVLAALRSPFLAGAEGEAGARAHLEHELRRRQQPAWTWAALERQAARGCPLLATCLRQARTLRRSWPARQSHAAWVASFTAVWEALGWPGEHPLDSAGFQLRHAWERVLDGLEGLDQISSSPLRVEEMLVRLRHSARARIFQPAAAPAPVQILGWFEATGLEFTHLWVTGMHDQAVPAPARPHPFLPWEWQRAAGLPQASAAGAAEAGARQWAALRLHSAVMAASYACRDAREQPQRPSPLLAECEPIAPAPSPASAAAAQAPMELLDDALAPPAGPEERHGGSELLRDQSDCPFRAFAHYRLHARRPQEVEHGLAATTRGSLLHRLLDRLWRELQTSAQLPAVGDAALQARVAALAAEVVSAEGALDGLPGLAGVECERLAAVVVDWLALERCRRPFHVLAIENRARFPFAGLELTLQRDRMDELEDGAHSGERVLLDYKSGVTSIAMWAEPRLKQPQLPLYLLTEAEPQRVAAMAFAQVRAGDMHWVGLERAPGVLAGEPLQKDAARSLSTQQIESWRVALEALAEEYLRGAAGVQPRDRDCCTFCDLAALCRIRAGGHQQEGSDG